MKFCPQCGTSLIPGDRFCQECGFDLSAIESSETPSPEGEITSAQPEEFSLCPQCGKKIMPGDRFCEECGFDTTTVKTPEPPVAEETITAVKPVPEPEPIQEIVKEAVPGLFCPQCGIPLVVGDRFCQECGFDTTKPEVPGLKQPVAEAPPKHTTPPAATVSQQPDAPVRKKNKALLWVFLIAGVALLGAGGWFGYNKFIKSPGDEVAVADTTTQEEPVITIDTSSITELTQDTVVVEEKIVTPPAGTQPLVTEKKKEKQPAKTQPKQPTQPNQSPQSAQQQQVSHEPKPVLKITPDEPASGSRAATVFFVGTKENPKNQNPKNPTKFSLNKETTITRIITDHFNEGNGDASGGTITLKDKSGSVIGQWKARPSANKSGVANAKWISDMNVTVPPGTYFIHDSNPSTWSKNILGVGFVEVIGIEK